MFVHEREQPIWPRGAAQEYRYAGKRAANRNKRAVNVGGSRGMARIAPSRWPDQLQSGSHICAGRFCHDCDVTWIRTDKVPPHLDGPAVVAAASGLMLLPENASRHVRLHRLAALGMALVDQGAAPASPSAVRSLLKRDDIGGHGILVQEDPYSEVLVQSISFFGGDFLVSAGAGEHTVADLENLLEAMFREPWMPDDMGNPARQLVQALLAISDLVLQRAGLKRGTPPGGSPRTPVDVPGAKGLKSLADATFISNDEIDSYGDWLRIVVDTFAIDPGSLANPVPMTSPTTGCTWPPSSGSAAATA